MGIHHHRRKYQRYGVLGEPFRPVLAAGPNHVIQMINAGNLGFALENFQ